MSHVLVNPYRFAATFDPLTLPGLAVWLDPSDAASITASGGAVSQVNDKSGNGRHFTQSSAGAKPATGAHTQNGLNVLDFDGGDWLDFDAGSDSLDIAPWTMFAVLYDSSGGGYRRVMNATTTAGAGTDYSGGQAIFLFRNNSAALAAICDASATATTGAYSDTTWFVGRSEHVQSPSGAVNVAVDGTAAASTGSGSPGNIRYLRLGNGDGGPSTPRSNEGWIGRMGEVILCNADLTAGEILAVEQYLAAKWGTPNP